MFSPDRVNMGGGVSNCFELLDGAIRDVICRDAMPCFRNVPVVKAVLGGGSGLFGAVSLVADAARG
jgi:glucokinase